MRDMHTPRETMRNIGRFWELVPLAVLGIALVALIPWISSRLFFPNEPFDVSVIYRSKEGDVEYFPLIEQLARGTITDGTIKETQGAILRAFPHATLLPHAVTVAAFGKYGFPVADVLVALGYFALLILLFRTLGVSRPLSTMAALCVTLRIPVHLLDSAGLPAIFTLWGMRIPRPFISELYFLFTLIAAMRLLVSRSPARLSQWLLLAGAFGLLIQGDLHAALLFAFSSPVLIFCVARRDGLQRTLRNGFYAGILLAAVISPFLVQRLLAHPDLSVRWGVFSMSRRAGFGFFRSFLSWKELAGDALAMGLVLFVGTRTPIPPDNEAPVDGREPVRQLLPYTLTLMFAALVCMPLSILILGSTVQPSHFDDRALRLYSYLAIAFSVLWLDRFLQRRGTWSESVVPYRPYVYGATVACLAIGFGFAIRQAAPYRNHLRPQFYAAHTEETKPSYRESFAELTTFLESNVPDDAVIASFDHQLYAWWLTFHRGYWFLVEPFVSSVPDDELEIRIALLCKRLNMPPEAYREFLQQPYMKIMWLGLLKYGASQWYRFAPLDDYTDQQRRQIDSDDFWQMIIPRSELRRLTTQYENLTLSEFAKRDLDVIVLSQRGPEQSWAPSADTWPMVFQNDGFRVYALAK